MHAMALRHMQIGEVADGTGLSLRTIRYYEEVGLVTPSARTAGGFRLYSETDVARLRLVKRMKPLDFSLEEMGDVLAVLDQLDTADPHSAEHPELVERLEMYRAAAGARVRALKDQLETAESFAADLGRELGRQKKRRTATASRSSVLGEAN
jgi:DNA-binding transcriptional MerR regulator